MKVLYCDMITYPQAEISMEAKRVEMDELLRTSDFVSLHMPLAPSTHHLINTNALHMMKPTAFLINSVRGQVADQNALIQVLQEGWIAGAGLDVYDPEPLSTDSPLLEMDNVVLSPHMASHTEEALLRMAMVVEDVINVIEGRPPKNTIPPP